MTGAWSEWTGWRFLIGFVLFIVLLTVFGVQLAQAASPDQNPKAGMLIRVGCSPNAWNIKLEAKPKPEPPLDPKWVQLNSLTDTLACDDWNNQFFFALISELKEMRSNFQRHGHFGNPSIYLPQNFQVRKGNQTTTVVKISKWKLQDLERTELIRLHPTVILQILAQAGNVAPDDKSRAAIARDYFDFLLENQHFLPSPLANPAATATRSPQSVQQCMQSTFSPRNAQTAALIALCR